MFLLSLVGIIVLKEYTVVCGPVPTNISHYDNVAFCTSYCDVPGYYQPAKSCVSQDVTVDVYCCGSQHHRYCCTDKSKDVGDTYPSVSHCPNSSWWTFQWRVIISLLGTLIVMLMLAACCYYCCGGDGSMPTRSRFRGRRRDRTTTGENGDEDHNSDNTSSFDPGSPYAFTPPEYDSLPKDPPKYCEIYSVDSGISNPSFVAAEETERNEVISSETTGGLPTSDISQHNAITSDTSSPKEPNTVDNQDAEASSDISTEPMNNGDTNEDVSQLNTESVLEGHGANSNTKYTSNENDSYNISSAKEVNTETVLTDSEQDHVHISQTSTNVTNISCGVLADISSNTSVPCLPHVEDPPPSYEEFPSGTSDITDDLS